MMLANAERLGWEAIAAAFKPHPYPLNGDTMKFIRDLLRKAAPTAAELRMALDGLPIEAAAEALREAETAYRAQLLSGDDGQEIVRTEQEIADAKRECSRLTVFAEELRAKIATAEEREHLDALAAKRDGAEKEARDVAALFTRRYGALVTEMIGMLNRLEVAETHVVEANGALQAAGLVDRVQDVEGRFIAGQELAAGRRLRYFLAQGGMNYIVAA